jgi:hypothetical protein
LAQRALGLLPAEPKGGGAAAAGAAAEKEREPALALA